jgi:hypothetical protein
MKRNVWLSAILALMAVSVSGQDRSIFRTAADVREGLRGSLIGTVVGVDTARRQLEVTADDDRVQRVVVITDAVSTQYHGFGGVINDSPEIFTGSSGFANVRVGDRIDIRGAGRGNARLAAEQITLLGRATDVGPTGVGGTRPPTSVSTPSATSTATNAPGGYAEGTIRQINASTGLIVIETAPPYRRMITVRASRNTPVYYRGEVYRIENLEVGDRIRAEADPRTAQADEITARVIDVTQSLQDAGGSATGDRITTLTGKVIRVSAGADTIRIDTGRSTVNVDMSRAEDADGRRYRASDVRVGDEVDITGGYSANSDVFMATTVRLIDDVFGDRDRDDDDNDVRDPDELGEFVAVTLSGTVTESLQTSPTLVIRERTGGRDIHVFVTTDFVYRTRAGTYANAERLAVNDPVLIKAFRDENGNYIAQTIRIR